MLSFRSEGSSPAPTIRPRNGPKASAPQDRKKAVLGPDIARACLAAYPAGMQKKHSAHVQTERDASLRLHDGAKDNKA